MLRASGRRLELSDSSADENVSGSSDSGEGFYFVQAADTQLGLMYNYPAERRAGTGGEVLQPRYPDSDWAQEMELCRQSVDILNNLQPRPAFFIVCGDLVDAFGDQYPSIRENQEKDFKEVFSHLSPDIPMICVCGNHDIGNKPTKESIDKYKTSFGDDYFTFNMHGCFFIVINSQFYEDSSHVPDLYAEHEAWLEQELERARSSKARHVVIFQHIPWFVRDPDEEKMYFNVDKELRLRKLEQFWQAGVRKIFCGHYHRFDYTLGRRRWQDWGG